jgi:hypothetical protein
MVKLSRFHVGEQVICIGNDGDKFEVKGCGWRKNYKFTIKDITVTSDGKYIYWPGKDDDGVFENELSLINNDWDE